MSTLMPKKTKYRKVQKGRLRGFSKGARTVHFGDYGLVALEPALIPSKQIKAVLLCTGKVVKKIKGAQLFLRMFPDKPITKKPAESRMGKGKGNPEEWAAVVKRGRVFLEILGVSKEEAKSILRAAAYKMSLKTKFVEKGQNIVFRKSDEVENKKTSSVASESSHEKQQPSV